MPAIWGLGTWNEKCAICYIQYQFKGAVKYGTFKSIDFKKNWYVKVPVVPRSLML